MTPYYIIAGNIDEVITYSKANNLQLNLQGFEIKYVTFSHDIASDINPNGIFIGTWKQNPQITDILSRLYLLCQGTKKKREIINQVIDDYRMNR
jgi:hypothetical protein